MKTFPQMICKHHQQDSGKNSQGIEIGKCPIGLSHCVQPPFPRQQVGINRFLKHRNPDRTQKTVTQVRKHPVTVQLQATDKMICKWRHAIKKKSDNRKYGGEGDAIPIGFHGCIAKECQVGQGQV